MTGSVVSAGVLLLERRPPVPSQGIAAVAEDDVYGRIRCPRLRDGLTGWGIVHIVLGALVLIAGYGLLKDLAWARVIVLASLSLVAQVSSCRTRRSWSVVHGAGTCSSSGRSPARQEEAGTDCDRAVAHRVV
ncbi:Integral membrane protein OS=Streptomyces fumanus OX=67302 GN=GCM10018772_38770 PE=4 SV=1 [Streptomyces fumanus]